MLNEGIRFTELKLITEDGQQLLVSKEEALRKAREEGLDLFLVAPNVSPPIAKILDYSHYKYEKEKKLKEAKKKSNQGANVLKELKLTPRIGAHDFQVRIKQAREFLTKGYKVKLTVFFKGRESTHPSLGYDMIEKFLGFIEDLGWADSDSIKPILLGKMMSIIIAPGRKRPAEVINTEQSSPDPSMVEDEIAASIGTTEETVKELEQG